MPPANIEALTRVHDGLAYRDGVLSGEATISADLLAQDLEFALRNKIPVENTASRLETYMPANQSQEELLHKALFLSRTTGRFMGLFALGGAGVGKSHVAVGLAKSLELAGQTSRYVHVPSHSLSLPGGQS